MNLILIMFGANSIKLFVTTGSSPKYFLFGFFFYLHHDNFFQQEHFWMHWNKVNISGALHISLSYTDSKSKHPEYQCLYILACYAVTFKSLQNFKILGRET